jgi:hypothetical protein
MVKISCEIEIISAGSFDSCYWVHAIQFEVFSRVRVIERRAFQECGMLLSISLPASTEVLEHLCFNGCRNLMDVAFEAGSKLRLIESEAFRGCSSLKSITIRKSEQGREGIDLRGVSGVEVHWFE